MKRFVTLAFTAIVALSLASGAQAQKSKNTTPKIDSQPTKTVQLYPRWSESLTVLTDGKKADIAAANAGKVRTGNKLHGQEQHVSSGINNVTDSSARIEFYIPKKCDGKMVIICPGGGYSHLACYHEGIYVAQWLNEHDIAAAVLYYRMPNHHHSVPMEDFSTAIRYCREHAREFGVKQIGAMGFSAGGHLVCCASTIAGEKDCVPDFTIAIYPRLAITPKTDCGTKINLLPDTANWKELGSKEKKAEESAYKALCDQYYCAKHISRNTPPTFIAHSTNDKTVPYTESLEYFQALLDKGVSAELHLYPEGEHGWGFDMDKVYKKDKFSKCREGFEAELANWIKNL